MISSSFWKTLFFRLYKKSNALTVLRILHLWYFLAEERKDPGVQIGGVGKSQILTWQNISLLSSLLRSLTPILSFPRGISQRRRGGGAAAASRRYKHPGRGKYGYVPS